MTLSNQVKKTNFCFSKRLVVFATITTGVLSINQSAIAQRAFDCDNFKSDITRGVSPDREDLVASKEAANCMIRMVTDYSKFVTNELAIGKSNFDKSDNALQFRILTATIADFLKRGTRNEVHYLRLSDNVKIANTLAQAARSSDNGIRRNSARILAYIVDNSTACVIIDHAFVTIKESYTNTPAILGRANLLAISKVVSLWARRENFNALNLLYEEVTKVVDAEIEDGNPNLGKTKELLEEIRERLNLQRELETQGKNPPKKYSYGILGSECKKRSYLNEEISKNYKETD